MFKRYIGTNITNFMAANGLSYRKFGLMAGLSTVTVIRLANKGNDVDYQISPRTKYVAATAMNVTVHQLEYEDLFSQPINQRPTQPKLDEQAQGASTPTTSGVPIVNKETLLQALNTNIGTSLRTSLLPLLKNTTRTTRLCDGDSSIAMLIATDDMAPTLSVGDVVLVDLNTNPSLLVNGDIVVAHCKFDGFYDAIVIRHYLVNEDGKHILYNERHKNQLEPIAILGKVIARYTEF